MSAADVAHALRARWRGDRVIGPAYSVRVTPQDSRPRGLRLDGLVRGVVVSVVVQDVRAAASYLGRA